MKGNELEVWIASLTTWNFITIQSNCLLIVNEHCAIFTDKPIVDFHITSLKLKLKNYRSYRDSTFTMH